MSERQTVRTQERLGYPVRRTYTKACNCQPATASGPRPVHETEKTPIGNLRIKVTYARLACDECGTPWEKEPPHD